MLSRFDVHRSHPYNCKLSSSNETVNQLAEDLYKTIEIDKTKKQSLKRDCAMTTLLNLKYSWDTSSYLRVSKDMNYYANYPKRYKYRFYTYKIVNGVVNGLEKQGKIEVLTGFKNFNDNSGQQTKIRPTDEFAEELKTIKRDMYKEQEPPELLILKNRKGNKNYKSYFDTNQTRMMRNSLVAYNELRQSNLMDLRGVNLNEFNTDETDKIKDFYNKFALTEDYYQSNISLRNPFIYRVFNDTFKLGGRYYGGIESNMPKILRSKIHINGAKTFEKDFSSMHIRMLYHLEGIEYNDDAYNIVSNGDPELRKLYKLIGLVTINSKDSMNAINGIRNEVRDKNLFHLLPDLKDESIKPFLVKWVSAHPRISKYLNSDYGIRLQNIDSMIAQDVVNHFTKQGKVVLVVHDSFVVSKEHESELISIMDESYYSKLKHKAIIN